MVNGYFITGTDTSVGKTFVSCALLHAFAAKNKTVVGMKPIVTGSDNGQWTDVELLKAASSVTAPDRLINQYALAPPLAPQIAAKQADIEIDPTLIQDAFLELKKIAKIVIIEGVGGFLVPLGTRLDGANLARKLNLPVILIVGMKLGCLNHALMTAQIVQLNGLSLAGWIANNIDPHMLAFQENIQVLEQRLDCPLLGTMPFTTDTNPKNVYHYLNLEKLS